MITEITLDRSRTLGKFYDVNSKKVGTIEGVPVYCSPCDGKTSFYELVFDGNIACAVTLKKVKGNVHEVSFVSTDNKFKGFNAPAKLYSFLVRKLGIVIKADKIQSAGGKSVWNALCDQKGVSVVAANKTFTDAHLCTSTEDGEVYCAVDVYEQGSYSLYAMAL